jgi:hypothetical protein
MAYNWDFFQIPHVGVPEPDIDGEYARTTLGTHIRREFGMRMSNFGSQVTTIRVSDDYTRTQLGFKAKGELENPKVTYGLGLNNDPTANHNPYVWGSTVKRVRDDEMVKMTMDSRNLHGADQPDMDVMDTKVVQADGMTAPKKYPTEGWSSFGGKYDGYEAYNGVLK